MDIPFINGGRQGKETGKHPQTDLANLHPQKHPQTYKQTHAQDTAPRKAHNHAEKRTCYYFFEKRKKYIVDNSITYKNHKQKPEKTCKDLLTTVKNMLLYF